MRREGWTSNNNTVDRCQCQEGQVSLPVLLSDSLWSKMRDDVLAFKHQSPVRDLIGEILWRNSVAEKMCCILHCVWPSPSTCFSLLERAQGDKISLQRQALIPIVSYTSRGGNIWVTLCSIITTFVASSPHLRWGYFYLIRLRLHSTVKTLKLVYTTWKSSW